MGRTTLLFLPNLKRFETCNCDVCRPHVARCFRKELLANPGGVATGKRAGCWKRVPGFGLLLILVKNLFGGCSDIFVKKLGHVNPVVLILFRSIVSLTISAQWSILTDNPPFPAGNSLKDRSLLIARCLISVTK